MANVSYPGVYVEEIPSGVRTIAGVSTSNTAFVDYFKRGPVNKAVRITSYGDFERAFGGLDAQSEASYAVQQYYKNGGSVAWVVRVTVGDPNPATVTLTDGTDNIVTVNAASPGEWGNNLDVTVAAGSSASNFNLTIREVVTKNGKAQIVNSETYVNLTMTPTDARYAVDVVNEASSLVNLVRESATDNFTLPTAITEAALSGGQNGTAPTTSTQLLGSSANKTGIYALERIAPEIFNILCLPAAANMTDTNLENVYSTAATYCEEKRAFLIVDIPSTIDTEAEMRTWASLDSVRHENAAVYFPRLFVSDALNEGRLRNVAASGTLAGVYARTDSTRGIWKAPAGTDASLRGADLAVKLTDLENGALNPIGVNVLRSFPIFGNISWGGRTLDGADQAASEWKYIPVRRTALYIEESLFQGLKWVVFEPNDEPLWAQIRLNVGAFMHNMFRQGAFQGTSAKEAYFVKCDKETTTQNDINLGMVNIVVGFAPLKPAEFVIIKLQQIAGQVEA